MGRLLPNCEEVSHLASQSMDEPISLTQGIGLRLHLMMCKWCRKYRKQLLMIREVLRKSPSDTDATARTSLSLKAKNRIDQSIKDKSD